MKIWRPSLLECTSDTGFCKIVLNARQILAYLGPGFFVTVGFIDPGNWATNIAAGSQFGYRLLWVVTLSTFILILWQHMSAHLGIILGKCLAEAAHDHIKPIPRFIYGVTAIMAGIATALAEILGMAVGIQILFHIPVMIGAVIACIVVAGTILLQRYRQLERFVVGLVSLIGLCYLVEMYLVKPNLIAAARCTIIPSLDSSSILIAMGVLGAVVMPHNMYLHSEVIQNRDWQGRDPKETRRLLRFEFLDTLMAMLAGLAINAAMIIVAAAVFHRHGMIVSDLAQAADSLRPIAGNFAKYIFGIALLAAGYSSSVTAGIAGGSIFSGYLGKQTDLESKWFKIGTLVTLIPALIIVFTINDVFRALIISQVCLSLQLPFTMLPLYLMTSSRKVMGAFTNGILEKSLMIVSGLVVLLLNILLVCQVFGVKF